MKYETQDNVLPILNFQASPVSVKIEITEDRVQLFVANRDWVWEKETGKFIGAGCCGLFKANQDAPQEIKEGVPVQPTTPAGVPETQLSKE